MENRELMKKMCIILCLLIPISWGVFLVLKYGINTFYMDEFSIVELAIKLERGGLRISDLFAQHNEHRMFFPNIIFLVFGKLFYYNTKVYMILGIVCISCSYFITISYLMKKQDRSSISMLCIEVLVIGFLYFNGAQWENLFLGYQLAWFLIILCVVTSLFCLQKYFENGKRSMIVGSIVLNVIASFSSMQGLWVWLVYIVIFVLGVIRKQKIKFEIWIATVSGMMVSFFLYFYDYAEPVGHLDYFGGGIKGVIQYFLVAIGGVFVSNVKWAMFIGGGCCLLSGVAFIIWLVYAKKMLNNVFEMGVMLYGYLVIASVTAGRSAYGVDQAMSSRYSSYVLLSIIATSVFYANKIIKILVKNDVNKIYSLSCKMGMAIISVMAIVLCMDNFMRFDDYQHSKDNRIQVKCALQNFNNESLEERQKIYPFGSYQDGEEWISFMMNNKINVYSTSSIDISR